MLLLLSANHLLEIIRPTTVEEVATLLSRARWTPAFRRRARAVHRRRSLPAKGEDGTPWAVRGGRAAPRRLKRDLSDGSWRARPWCARPEGGGGGSSARGGDAGGGRTRRAVAAPPREAGAAASDLGPPKIKQLEFLEAWSNTNSHEVAGAGRGNRERRLRTPTINYNQGQEEPSRRLRRKKMGVGHTQKPPFPSSRAIPSRQSHLYPVSLFFATWSERGRQTSRGRRKNVLKRACFAKAAAALGPLLSRRRPPFFPAGRSAWLAGGGGTSGDVALTRTPRAGTARAAGAASRGPSSARARRPRSRPAERWRRCPRRQRHGKATKG